MRENAVFQAVLPGFTAEHLPAWRRRHRGGPLRCLEPRDSGRAPGRRHSRRHGAPARGHRHAPPPALARASERRCWPWAGVNLLKLVIVVEDDVDPEDCARGRMVARGPLPRRRGSRGRSRRSRPTAATRCTKISRSPKSPWWPPPVPVTARRGADPSSRAPPQAVVGRRSGQLRPVLNGSGSDHRPRHGHHDQRRPPMRAFPTAAA